MSKGVEKPALSAKEAALIGAARRELPAHGVTARGPASLDTRTAAHTLSSSAPRPALDRAASAAPRPNPAERAAALLQLEKEESFRRRKRTRWMALVLPTALLIGATLWVVAILFHWGAIL